MTRYVTPSPWLAATVAVAVGVTVAVAVGVNVAVGTGVGVKVAVGVGVKVALGVGVNVAVEVGFAVAVGVGDRSLGAAVGVGETERRGKISKASAWWQPKSSHASRSKKMHTNPEAMCVDSLRGLVRGRNAARFIAPTMLTGNQESQPVGWLRWLYPEKCACHHHKW